jgi:hypothetical protein
LSPDLTGKLSAGWEADSFEAEAEAEFEPLIDPDPGATGFDKVGLAVAVTLA